MTLEKENQVNVPRQLVDQAAMNSLGFSQRHRITLIFFVNLLHIRQLSVSKTGTHAMQCYCGTYIDK